jgi:hypothetical protein
MISARFEGGPYDGLTLGLAGTPPGFMLLIEHPADASYPAPIVVGADFDDHWPGQQRYELALIADADARTPTAVYRHTQGGDSE